jgi:hypothetical protein
MAMRMGRRVRLRFMGMGMLRSGEGGGLLGWLKRKMKMRKMKMGRMILRRRAIDSFPCSLAALLGCAVITWDRYSTIRNVIPKIHVDQAFNIFYELHREI